MWMWCVFIWRTWTFDHYNQF